MNPNCSPQLPSNDTDLVAQPLIDALCQRQHTVATCESLTAGLLSATIANVPGASAVLRGSLITYATDLKGELAGVPQELLEHYGPIDPGTAAAMALGAAIECNATWGISCTGVAGPDSQDGHAVGEIYVGFAYRDLKELRSLVHSYRIGQNSHVASGSTTSVLELHHMGSLEIDGANSQEQWQQALVTAAFIRNTQVTDPVAGDRKAIRQATVQAAIQGLSTLVANPEIPQLISC